MRFFASRVVPRCVALASVASVVALGVGASAGPASVRAQRPEARTRAGWLSPAAKACKQKLYVSSAHLNYVDVYCTRGHNQAPIGEITDGIDEPEGANTDASGNLYVTNTGSNTVTEYAPNNVSPSFTYSAQLGAPAGVAVDAQGNVYVSDLSPAGIVVFPQASNSPSRTLGGLTFPIDLALDPHGDLYVTTYTASFGAGAIYEFAPGSSQGTNLGIVTGAPGGIALDRKGDIVTADQRLPGVLVFPPGATQPAQTFAQNLLDPDPVRFDRRENQVYVGDAVGNTVYVYSYPADTLVDTITDGIDGPNGLALDPAPPL